MLPGEELPLRIFEPRYSAMVADCLAMDDPAFGVVLIAAGREVGGGDTRSDVGALAHITEVADFGDGRYRLKCVVAERIRVLEWHPDNPYPRAAIELWPDEPGEAVGADAIRDVEDRMIALFERIASARGADVNGRDIVVGADASGDAAMWLYALATRLPMGQADRYAVLAAPTVAARLAALSDAVETVTRDGRVSAVRRLAGLVASFRRRKPFGGVASSSRRSLALYRSISSPPRPRYLPAVFGQPVGDVGALLDEPQLLGSAIVVTARPASASAASVRGGWRGAPDRRTRRRMSPPRRGCPGGRSCDALEQQILGIGGQIGQQSLCRPRGRLGRVESRFTQRLRPVLAQVDRNRDILGRPVQPWARSVVGLELQHLGLIDLVDDGAVIHGSRHALASRPAARITACSMPAAPAAMKNSSKYLVRDAA